MGYRQVIIKKSNKIKLKDNNIVVLNENKENKIPLEDINFIILEDNKTIITARLLTELSKYHISLIMCNEKYEPSLIMYSYNNHYKQLETFNKQLSLNNELKDKLWQHIVKKKIENEIHTLNICTKEEKTINKLNEYIKEIQEGDITK